jgi:hypothetical protein
MSALLRSAVPARRLVRPAVRGDGLAISSVALRRAAAVIGLAVLGLMGRMRP